MKAGTLKFCQDKKDWLVVIFLFVITTISRIPFRSQFLYSWDSGNFALGVLNFDPASDQPHAPGYPLYILAGKAVNLILDNANTSLVLVSIISVSISISLIYRLGARIFNRSVGLTVAILLFASPLVWFQSEVALAHIVELPFAILAVWLLFEAWFSRRFNSALIAAIVIGIGGGFRQDILLFYGPVLFIASLRLGNIRKALAVWSLVTVSVLGWFLPLLYLMGGLGNYRSVSGSLNHAAFQSAIWNTGLEGFRANMGSVLASLGWLLGSAVIFLVAFGFEVVFLKAVRKETRIWFLMALSILPLAFFVATSFSHYGYSLIYAPSIFLITAYSVTRLATGLRRYGGKVIPLVLTVILCGIVVLNMGSYFRPSYLGNRIWSQVGFYSNLGIKNADAEMAAIIGTVKLSDPESTLIVLANYADTPNYYRQLMYYLPEYRIVWLRPDYGGFYHVASNYGEFSASPESPPLIEVSSQYKQLLALGWRGNIRRGVRLKDIRPGITEWIIPMSPILELPPYTIKAE